MVVGYSFHCNNRTAGGVLSIGGLILYVKNHHHVVDLNTWSVSVIKILSVCGPKSS